MVGDRFLFNDSTVPTKPDATTFEIFVRDCKDPTVVIVEPTVGDVAIDGDGADDKLQSACVTSSSPPSISNIILRTSSTSITTCQF